MHSEPSPGAAQKNVARRIYDDISRRLAASTVGETAAFLNYGYVGTGEADDSMPGVSGSPLNKNSVRLARELIGDTRLDGMSVLDVGCGRGGTSVLMATSFNAKVSGIDLSTEAIAFCRSAHEKTSVRFDVGDAENLPVPDDSFDVITNLESSHAYPDLDRFLSEVARVLHRGGMFLHADMFQREKWFRVRSMLDELGFTMLADRDITPNVLAARDDAADRGARAFRSQSRYMRNFLAVPGSDMYEQLRLGHVVYRIMRSRKSA